VALSGQEVTVSGSIADEALVGAVAQLLAERDDLERRLADPAVHADPATARTLGRRYSELTAVVQAHDTWNSAREDVQAAEELAEHDPAFAAELPPMRDLRDDLRQRLHRLLTPRDPDDDRDAIIEIKAGEGGEESALFAGDLLRMYLRYAERRGWRAEVLDSTPSGLGGYKDVSVAVKSRGGPVPGEGVYARLKFEGGVHRVQRVPVTESQGRVHTSAAGVLVLPEAEEVEITISPEELRVDVFRSSGPGGQSVNTTDSAVRLTHLPTGIVVSCQNEKSQLQNREQASRILRARLHAMARERAEAEATQARRSQVRTVDRSERIRTYNFPENRIADHRTGFKAYNLDQVLDGELDPVIAACVTADEASRLVGAGADPVGGTGVSGATG
jgi:peptide chain release factor 1